MNSYVIVELWSESNSDAGIPATAIAIAATFGVSSLFCITAIAVVAVADLTGLPF